MELKCEFCSNIFTKKQALVYHQKTAKYCLKLRGASVTYKCELCNKELSDKRYLEKHREKCEVSTERKLQELTELKHSNTEVIQQVTELKHTISELTQRVEFSKKIIEDKERQILQKDEQIKELQNKLENIAIQGVKKSSSTSITNNQTINNLIPITDDHLKEQSRFLTLEHIKQGAVGYANFACEHALKDRVTCTDLSRRKIKYKNPEGQLVSDPEMMVISKKLFCAISEKNKELSDQYRGELINMMLAKYRECGDDMKDEETRELEKYIAEINKNMDHLLTVYGQARDIAEGQRPEMYHEFVREVCSKTVS